MKRIISFWHFTAPREEKKRNPHSLISPWEINGGKNRAEGCVAVIKETCRFRYVSVSFSSAASCFDVTYLSHEEQPLGLWMCFKTGFTPVRVFASQKHRPVKGSFSCGCFFTVLFLGFCYDIWKKVLGCVAMVTQDGARQIVALCQGLSLRVKRSVLTPCSPCL